MEARPVGDGEFPLRRLALYAAAVAAFVAVVVSPGLVWLPYSRALETVLLLLVLMQMGRLVASALMTLSAPPDPPALERTPTVSVVVPAYNEGAVLEETIASLNDLDYPQDSLEVVVAYEADSDDETGAIARRAAAAEGSPRVTAVECDGERSGKAAAVNDAVECASGELIALIDADHRFEPGAVQRAVRRLTATEDVWCVKGRCYGRNSTDSLVALYATVERHMMEKADLFAREVYGGFTLFDGGQAFFEREAFEVLGGFDEEMLLEDIDMSARLHEAGKRVRVDPEVVTYEEQPTTLRGWWAQRKRWARGWLQVSVRHFGRLVRSPRPSLTTRLDAVYTFVTALAFPFLVVGMGLPVVDLLQPASSAYIPHSEEIWVVIGAFPPLVTCAVFLDDRRAGREHPPREWLAALTIGPILVVNTFTYVVAFIEEFVARRPAVFVTTSRSGDD
jgi:cellulose synthase/poly-beta-1,6-N-acetylglucosamine synthase-like glycosyltransferase